MDNNNNKKNLLFDSLMRTIRVCIIKQWQAHYQSIKKKITKQNKKKTFQMDQGQHTYAHSSLTLFFYCCSNFSNCWMIMKSKKEEKTKQKKSYLKILVKILYETMDNVDNDMAHVMIDLYRLIMIILLWM